MLDSLRTSGLLRLLRDIAIVAAVLFVIDQVQTRGHTRGELPHFILQTLQGDTMRSSSLTAGKRTLVVVWAPWCAVCKLETGNIQRVRSWIEPSMRVVSIAASFQKVEEVRDFVNMEHVDYPVFLGDRKATEALGVQAFPSFFVLDPDGSIVGSVQGYTTMLGLWLRANFAGRLL